MKPLGLIAGEGVFPILVARGAGAAGRKVICVGLHGNCWPELRAETDHFQEAGILRIGKWIHILRAQGCDEVIIVGRVKKSLMYDRWRYFRYIPDWRTVRMWFGRLRHDKRPRAVLDAMADETGLGRDNALGFDPVLQRSALHRRRADDASAHGRPVDRYALRLGDLPHHQPPGHRAGHRRDQPRHHRRRGPGRHQRHDRARRPALQNRRLDHDQGRQRPGRLPSWTCRPSAPPPSRSFMPAGAGCLVLEAGKTIILERTKTLELADRYKIAIVGYDPSDRDCCRAPAQPRPAEGAP